MPPRQRIDTSAPVLPSVRLGIGAGWAPAGAWASTPPGIASAVAAAPPIPTVLMKPRRVISVDGFISDIAFLLLSLGQRLILLEIVDRPELQLTRQHVLGPFHLQLAVERQETQFGVHRKPALGGLVEARLGLLVVRIGLVLVELPAPLQPLGGVQRAVD